MITEREARRANDVMRAMDLTAGFDTVQLRELVGRACELDPYLIIRAARTVKETGANFHDGPGRESALS